MDVQECYHTKISPTTFNKGHQCGEDSDNVSDKSQVWTDTVHLVAVSVTRGLDLCGKEGSIWSECRPMVSLGG